jgi:hypothetical protein
MFLFGGGEIPVDEWGSGSWFECHDGWRWVPCEWKIFIEAGQLVDGPRLYARDIIQYCRSSVVSHPGNP